MLSENEQGDGQKQETADLHSTTAGLPPGRLLAGRAVRATFCVDPPVYCPRTTMCVLLCSLATSSLQQRNEG